MWQGSLLLPLALIDGLILPKWQDADMCYDFSLASNQNLLHGF